MKLFLLFALIVATALGHFVASKLEFHKSTTPPRHFSQCKHCGQVNETP